MKPVKHFVNKLRAIKNPLNRRKGTPEERQGREELHDGPVRKMFTIETSQWPNPRSSVSEDNRTGPKERRKK